MQARQVRKRLTRLEQWLNRAAEYCRRERALAPELRHDVAQLDDAAELAAQSLQSEEDLGRMASTVSALEELGTDVERACERDPSPEMAQEVTAPVHKANKALQRLKRQLS